MGLSGLAKAAADGLTLHRRVQLAARNAQQPTPAQAEAGNYRKGHINFHGMRITIEVPKGGIRKGTDPNGKHWEIRMPHPYGYVRGTAEDTADGDHLDVFIGPHPHAELVYVIDQSRPDTGRFDEHKAVLGSLNLKEAKEIYLAAYEPGWKGMAAITPMTIQQFREWLEKGDLHRPISKQVLYIKAAKVDDSTVDKELPAIIITRHMSYQLILPRRTGEDHEAEDHSEQLLKQLDQGGDLTESPAPHSQSPAEEPHPTDKSVARAGVMAELDAVNLYEQMASKVSNSDLRDLLLRIAREEKVHCGEFTALLEKVDKEHRPAIAEGKAEVKHDA